MTWHYGIVKHVPVRGEPWFALHELYFNPEGHTTDPVGFVGDTREEVIEALEMALRDAKKHPVKEDYSLEGEI